jgi:hypothetical protein
MPLNHHHHQVNNSGTKQHILIHSHMEHPALLFILPLLGLAMACQLIAHSDAAQVQAQAQPIYDTDGHELTKENLYSILPADRHMSGLCLYIGNLTPTDCPPFANVARC